MNKITGNKIHIFFLFILMSGHAVSIAQHNLRLRLNKSWNTGLIDSVTVSGHILAQGKAELNNTFSPRVDQWFIDVPHIKGEISYQVNCRIFKGKNITDKNYSGSFLLNSDTVINLDYDHTSFIHADTVFNLQNGFAAVNIYLPDGYNPGGQKFPVLYYITADSISGISMESENWIKQYLDSLQGDARFRAILVKISKFSSPLNDPFDSLYQDRFSDLLVKQLKPFIDRKYRTLSAKDNTFIAGSSFGANEAYYAILNYPQVFGRAGIFSPILNPNRAIVINTTYKLAPGANGMFFFYIGKSEEKENVMALSKTMDTLGAGSKSLMYVVYDPEGNHSELYWKKWFPEFHRWANSNGLNYIIRN